MDEATERGPDAVTAMLREPIEEGNFAVRTACEAMARAQDAIGRLRDTIDRSRAVRARARGLQDEAYRLRRAVLCCAGEGIRHRLTTDRD